MEQPIVVATVKRLTELGITARPISFSRAKPSGDFGPEVDELRRARDQLNAEKIAFVGRSFGGRVCTRLAAIEPPDALVVLGHPIAPRNRPRPEDEVALANVSCPTLIVQGERDPLGPLAVLEKIAKGNTHVEIYVLKGVGHQFGKRQPEGIAHAARWLIQILGDTASG